MGQLFSQQQRVAVSAIPHGTTETTLVGTGVGSASLVSGFFRAGDSLGIDAGGHVVTEPAASATLRIRIKKGSTVIADTGVLAVPNGLIGTQWRIRAFISARSTTSVCVMTVFEVVSGTAWLAYQMPAYTGALQSGLTTIGTTAEAISITAQWGTSVTDGEEIVCDYLILSTP